MTATWFTDAGHEAKSLHELSAIAGPLADYYPDGVPQSVVDAAMEAARLQLGTSEKRRVIFTPAQKSTPGRRPTCPYDREAVLDDWATGMAGKDIAAKHKVRDGIVYSLVSNARKLNDKRAMGRRNG